MADEETKDPMEFSTAVSTWIGETREKIAELLEQAGTPTLGIDAQALDVLTRVDRQLAEAGADIAVQIPVVEEPPAE